MHKDPTIMPEIIQQMEISLLFFGIFSALQFVNKLTEVLICTLKLHILGWQFTVSVFKYCFGPVT